MKSLIQTASSSEERLERIGFLRILNEENTIIPCLLSVAPVLDHIIILWSDTEDRSIELMEAWKRHIEDNYECRMSFLHYPHHVVPPRSVDDLRILPRENRIDTYLNFGMDFIRDLYAGKSFCVGKVDADQIYFTQELEEAFQMARKPEDCVSIGGHNTLVFQKRLMIFGPRPRNGGSDSLICGMNNLPHFGVAAPYEVDIARHPCIKAYSRACWMHFRRKARYKNVIREFREDEVIPLPQNPGLVNRFRTDILPLLQEANSPYVDLSLD
ncbi:hypothetical protein [Akkermansia sp.]|uniref:hypothetical protein n=1 Tax=Akkermansia sp. TaxID=1872421 RepID=UPI003992B49E